MVRWLITEKHWTARKALKLAHMSPSLYAYQKADHTEKNAPLIAAMKALAEEHPLEWPSMRPQVAPQKWPPHMGLPMMVLHLRQQGFKDNKKRIRRLYKLEKLNLRIKTKKSIQTVDFQPLERPQHPNHTWSMDFVYDRIGWKHERMIKCLTIVDDTTDEALSIHTQLNISGADVVQVLETLKQTRGLPKRIRTDNGKEFRSKAIQEWAKANNVTLLYIQPGKPNQNAIIESFNSRLRQECLNQNHHISLAEAQNAIEQWRIYFNTQRPKQRLGGLTPSQYAATLTSAT